MLWSTGLAASRYVEFSWTRDSTHVPRIARWILNQWITREVPEVTFYNHSVTGEWTVFCTYQYRKWKFQHQNVTELWMDSFGKLGHI